MGISLERPKKWAEFSLGLMKTRSDYDAALDVVASVINAWDPFSLLRGGSPSDEFDAEIAALVPRIRHIHSAEDAAREIATVFSKAFDPTFTSEACAKVGAQLYSRLQEASLLATSHA
jgi:hypothetical protein